MNLSKFLIRKWVVFLFTIYINTVKKYYFIKLHWHSEWSLTGVRFNFRIHMFSHTFIYLYVYIFISRFSSPFIQKPQKQWPVANTTMGPLRPWAGWALISAILIRTAETFNRTRRWVLKHTNPNPLLLLLL